MSASWIQNDLKDINMQLALDLLFSSSNIQ